MNLSEAMKFKREIRANCGIDVNMLDTPEAGFVLYVERNTIEPDSYKLLADFAEQNRLSLQLESGRFIVSTHALRPH